MGMIARLIEPRRETVPMDRQMFSNMDLKQLILPLIVEAAGCVSAAASGGRSGSSDKDRLQARGKRQPVGEARRSGFATE